MTTGIVEKVIAERGTEFGTRADRRLHEEMIGWLVTVRPDGLPLPVPVWFLWDGETIVVYSQPGTPKLRNIAANPKVALHLDGNGRGGDIVVVSGEARVDREHPARRQGAGLPGQVRGHDPRRLGFTGRVRGRLLRAHPPHAQGDPGPLTAATTTVSCERAESQDHGAKHPDPARRARRRAERRHVHRRGRLRVGARNVEETSARTTVSRERAESQDQGAEHP